jgi:hypothetical protein
MPQRARVNLAARFRGFPGHRRPYIVARAGSFRGRAHPAEDRR